MLKRMLPPLGMRIIKTAVAVFICLCVFGILDSAFGYRENVAASVIAAIICMQPYAADSRTFAADRIFGTFLGAMWALLFLLLMRCVPVLSSCMLAVYIVMGCWVILALYSTVLLKKTSVAGLVAITLMCTIINYPDVQTPVAQTLTNLLATVIGTVVAILVNVCRLPRTKHPERLFFVRTMDLVPDRYAQIPSSVHIELDRLYSDGAKICLISRWAPAFIISQMGLLNVNVPMIIMDGAALYDVQRNRYLDVIDIPKEHVERLRAILSGFNTGFNVYAVNEQSMAIYHLGPVNEAEHREAKMMRRSLYRNYMDGSYHEDDFIAFARVIDTAEKIDELAHQLQSVLPNGMFRVEERQEGHFPEYKGLYFYDPKASVAEMKHRVTLIAERENGGKLEAIDLLPRTTKYLPEHDALLLLNRLKNMFEPVEFKRKNK